MSLPSAPSADLMRVRWTTHGLDRLHDSAERATFLHSLSARNPGRTPADVAQMSRWSLAEYDRTHLPIVIGTLRDPASFCSRSSLRILDMPIRAPGGPWILPQSIAQFGEVLALTVACERAINPDLDTSYYVYVTVDQKRVENGVSQRRVGWHGDGFISPETTRLDEGPVWVDNTYVVSDQLPTLFLPGPFSLRGLDATDIRAVLARFEELAAGKDPVRFEPFTVVRMTPYDIHTPDVNTSGKVIDRTFVKIQFSRDRLNMLGNTLNRVEDEHGRPLFSYDAWTWIPRNPNERNNRNSIQGWDRPDRDRFREVVPGEIDFDAESPGVPWLAQRFFHARKVEGVRAQPAVPDEMLETVGARGGFRSSFNIAQAGDWKITTSQGDQYFLSDARVRERYEPPLGRAECFLQPRSTPSRMVEIVEPIRYRSPWGAWAFAPRGSVLTKLGAADVYAILPENFAASYVACDVDGHVLVRERTRLSDARRARPGGLLRVRDEPFELAAPAVAVFDLHGTLSEPNWKAALAGVHRRLVARSTPETSAAWVEENVPGRSDAEVLLALARTAGGLAVDEIERCFQEQRRIVGRTERLRAMPGVRTFLEILRQRGVPMYVLTFAHTARERTLEQLAEAEIAAYFDDERVLTSHAFPGLVDRPAFREAGLERVADMHAQSTLWFFNDTAEGVAWTRARGGIAFGVPQGQGVDWERRATPLIAAGAHVLVQDWEHASRDVADALR